MRLLTMKELRTEKGIAYSAVHIRRLFEAQKFPRPIHVGANRIGFIESEIDDWIKSKVQERDAAREAA